jgi:hypothetical protein
MSQIDTIFPIDRIRKSKRTSIVYDLDAITPHVSITIGGVKLSLDHYRIGMPLHNRVAIMIYIAIGNSNTVYSLSE